MFYQWLTTVSLNDLMTEDIYPNPLRKKSLKAGW